MPYSSHANSKLPHSSSAAIVSNERLSTAPPSSGQHAAVSSNGNSNKLIISKGPLSYNYTLDHIIIHYGSDSAHGSEHLIDGNAYPLEVQLYSFNSQLYSSWKEAESRPNGIAAIAILGLIANGDTASKTNSQVKIIAEAAKASSLKQGEYHSCKLSARVIFNNTLHASFSSSPYPIHSQFTLKVYTAIVLYHWSEGVTWKLFSPSIQLFFCQCNLSFLSPFTSTYFSICLFYQLDITSLLLLPN